MNALSDFVRAMQAALARYTAAETPEERQEAEDAMARLIRGSSRREPTRFDPKQAAAGRDDE